MTTHSYSRGCPCHDCTSHYSHGERYWNSFQQPQLGQISNESDGKDLRVVYQGVPFAVEEQLGNDHYARYAHLHVKNSFDALVRQVVLVIEFDEDHKFIALAIHSEENIGGYKSTKGERYDGWLGYAILAALSSGSGTGAALSTGFGAIGASGQNAPAGAGIFLEKHKGS